MKNRLFPFRLKEEGSCSLARRVTVLIVMFGLCLLLHSLIMLIMTDKPFAAYAAIFKGAFSSPYQVSQTLLRSLPIMLIGLGMSISLRAGVLNLGGNGCLLAGGIGATVVGLYAGSLPPFIAITLTILAAMAFGAIWSGIAGILRAKLKISEIYVTVMLNYVMVYISTYLLEGVWQNVIKLNWTDTINPNTQWPTLFAGTPVHLGFALLVAVFAAVVYLNRTPLGFEIKAFGLNNKATLFKLKETDNQKIVMFVMLFAGAIAGLAGASQVLRLPVPLQPPDQQRLRLYRHHRRKAGGPESHRHPVFEPAAGNPHLRRHGHAGDDQCPRLHCGCAPGHAAGGRHLRKASQCTGSSKWKEVREYEPKHHHQPFCHDRAHDHTLPVRKPGGNVFPEVRRAQPGA